MDQLEKQVSWVPCPRCSKEFNRLTPRGICIDCSDADDLLAKMDHVNGEVVLRSIGRYGMEKYHFESFQECDGTELAAVLANQFDPKKNNLYLWGPCGTGKTHLAGAIFKKAAGMGVTLRWTNPIYLARGVRGKFGTEDEVFVGNVAAAGVLVLDDIGVGRDSPAILQTIYEIMELRKNAKINGLIITTNHSPQELAKKFGDDRFSSRITELCDVAEMKSADHRLMSQGAN